MLPPFKHTISDTIYVDKSGFTFRLKKDYDNNVLEVEVYLFLFRPAETPVFKKIDPSLNFNLISDNINHPYQASGTLSLQYDSHNRVNKIWGRFRYGNEVMHEFDNEMLPFPIPVPPGPPPPVPPEPPLPPIPPFYPDDNNEEVIIENVNYFDLCHFKTIRPPAESPVSNNRQLVSDEALLSAASEINVQSDCKGYISLLGIGELLVIKQHLLRYELGEIAFIENVMMYQLKKHTDKQMEEQRTIYADEQDKTTREEEDLLKSEDYNIGQEIGALAAGDKETFSYDPNITKTFTNTSEALTGGWTLTMPSKNMTSNLLRYVRNLTGKASHHLKQKIASHYERTGIIRKTSIDTSKIDNRGNNTNLRGIYRWMNKVFSTSLINYGRRIIVEFGVPDPAASFRISDGAYNIPVPPKSLPPAFSYQSITRNNYLQYVSDYNLKDYPVPPDAVKSVMITLQNMPEQASAFMPVPDGYIAMSAVVSYIFNGTELMGMIGDSFFDNQQNPYNPSSGANAESTFLSNASPLVHMGDTPLPSSGYYYPAMFPSSMTTGTAVVPLNNIVHTIPVSVICNSNFYTVNIDVSCNCIPDIYQRWQVQFFQLVITAYESQREAYFKKKDLKEIWTLQRKIEKSELKKGCMRLLIALEKNNIPLSFFEQAFEWEKMTYTFFAHCIQQDISPEWESIHQELFRDPVFNKFLEAKSAKVDLAVRRGYEMQVLNLIYGMSENNKSAVSQQYLNYCYEIERMEDREIRMGDPWNIVVPTSMTTLQESQDLPVFCNNDPV